MSGQFCEADSDCSNGEVCCGLTCEEGCFPWLTFILICAGVLICLMITCIVCFCCGCHICCFGGCGRRTIVVVSAGVNDDDEDERKGETSSDAIKGAEMSSIQQPVKASESDPKNEP